MNDLSLHYSFNMFKRQHVERRSFLDNIIYSKIWILSLLLQEF